MAAPLTRQQWAEIRAASVASVLSADGSLPGVLLSYQGRAVSLLDSTAIKVLFIEKSRRIGMTWGLASYAGLKAARGRGAGGMDVMYISYSQDMTREFIDAVAMWARAFAVAAFELEEFLFDDTDPADPAHTRQIQAFRIRFASGFEVMGLSSAPRSLRGKQGVVIIDEAAFVDNLAELMKAALAFLMWGGQVVVCSTHNGAENEFNARVQDVLAGRLPYAHMKVDFDEALTEGLYQRICLVTRTEWTPEGEAQWRDDIVKFYGDAADEELFCIPAQGSGAWLTAPLIEARMTLLPERSPVIRIELPDTFLQLDRLAQAQLFEPQFDRVKSACADLNANEPHGFGYDPARKSDPAVMALLAIETTLSRRLALTVECRNVPFAEQKRLAECILKAAPRLMGAAVDATGMGMNLAEDLGRTFGLHVDDASEGGLVWPVTLRAAWYNVNFPPLKAAFEDGTIALCRDEPHLSDLRLVKIIRGVPQIPDERQGEAGKKRHGDFAVALGLAHFATRLAWAEYSYVTPGAGDGGPDAADHWAEHWRPRDALIRGGTI